MERKKFDLDDQKKEHIFFQNQLLHYGLYTRETRKEIWQEIPWHWHDEFEFGYIEKGSVLYKTNRQEFTLDEGNGVFINSGTLHYLKVLVPLSEIRLNSQFFDKSFLSGYSGSIFDIKYVEPVKECKALDALPLYRSNPKHAEFLDKLCKCENMAISKEPFYELHIRNLFSELWETVYSWAAERKKNNTGYDSKEDTRLKKMLSLIHKYSGEKITALDLA